MLRGEILAALAMFGHEPTLDEASRRFQVFLDDRNTPLLPPDIKKVVNAKHINWYLSFPFKNHVYNFVGCYLQAVYVAVMQRVSPSNKLDYELLLRIYRESDLSQEKTRILSNYHSHINWFGIYWSLWFSGNDVFICIVGSLASCPDPNIILEVLNFLLSAEVL